MGEEEEEEGRGGRVTRQNSRLCKKAEKLVIDVRGICGVGVVPRSREMKTSPSSHVSVSASYTVTSLRRAAKNWDSNST